MAAEAAATVIDSQKDDDNGGGGSNIDERNETKQLRLYIYNSIIF